MKHQAQTSTIHYSQTDNSSLTHNISENIKGRNIPQLISCGQYDFDAKPGKCKKGKLQANFTHEYKYTISLNKILTKPIQQFTKYQCYTKSIVKKVNIAKLDCIKSKNFIKENNQE